MNATVGAFVVLVKGKRWTWKCKVDAAFSERTVPVRYSGYVPTDRPYTVAVSVHADMASASAWCRKWERHPDAPQGFEP